MMTQFVTFTAIVIPGIIIYIFFLIITHEHFFTRLFSFLRLIEYKRKGKQECLYIFISSEFGISNQIFITHSSLLRAFGMKSRS